MAPGGVRARAVAVTNRRAGFHPAPYSGRVAIQSQMDRISAIFLPKTMTNKRLVWIKPLKLRDFVISSRWNCESFSAQTPSLPYGRTVVNTRGCAFKRHYAGRRERQTARPSAP